MKNLIFLTPIIYLLFSNNSYAFDIVSYLKSKLSLSYIEINSDCHSHTENCSLYNQYHINIDKIDNKEVGKNKGYVIISINCHTKKSKLDFIINHNPIYNNYYIPGEENYFANYIVKFPWSISEDSPIRMQKFNINDDILPILIYGHWEDAALSYKYCTREIINTINSLNGDLLQR